MPAILFSTILVLLLANGWQASANDHSYLDRDQDECDSKRCPSLDLLQTQQRKVRIRSPAYHQILDNDYDMSYTGNIAVGGQNMKAIFDTGSFELLLFSAQCLTCGEAAQKGYDSRLSSSYKPGQLTQIMVFGSGSTICSDAEDDLRIGPVSVKAQPVWEVVDANMPILDDANFQAILGLGPPAAVKLQAEDDLQHVREIAEKYKSQGKAVPAKIRRSLREEAAADKAMESLDDSVPANAGVRFLSICFEQAHGANGHLIWNDRDPSVQGHHFTRLQVEGQFSWKLALKNVNLVMETGKKYHIGCSNGCDAVLDSGTSLISGPGSAAEDMSNILVSLGAGCENQVGLPTLEFDLGGVHHVLPPEVYLGYIEGELMVPDKNGKLKSVLVKECDLLLMETGDDFMEDGVPLWIMGMPFFRWYKATFDFGEDVNDPTAKRSIWTAPVDEKCQLRQATDVSTLQSLSASPNLSSAAEMTEMMHWNVSYRPRTVVEKKIRRSPLVVNASLFQKHSLQRRG